MQEDEAIFSLRSQDHIRGSTTSLSDGTAEIFQSKLWQVNSLLSGTGKAFLTHSVTYVSGGVAPLSNHDSAA
jgi:hypothetical protein